jgi:hypothetical protein
MAASIWDKQYPTEYYRTGILSKKQYVRPAQRDGRNKKLTQETIRHEDMHSLRPDSHAQKVRIAQNRQMRPKQSSKIKVRGPL